MAILHNEKLWCASEEMNTLPIMFKCVKTHDSWVRDHYKNTPIQIYSNFHLQKQKIFRQKSDTFFHISAQNIDCGYSLEPPRWGGSNEYPQSVF